MISCRGLGAGPNGGKDFIKPVQGTYIGDIQLATFQKIKMPDAKQLAVYTKQSISNTMQAVTVTDDVKQSVASIAKTQAKPHQIYCLHHQRKQNL